MSPLRMAAIVLLMAAAYAGLACEAYEERIRYRNCLTTYSKEVCK